MKERILGIDAGTNSLGWAIVDYDAEKETDKYTLVDSGVNIFAEGVKIEKGIESSRASERTVHKHIRLGYWRRKVRKISLLRLLRQAGMCPNVTDDQLKMWRKKKVYPKTDEFMLWQMTSEEENDNPYFFRNLCLSEKLDLSVQKNRYIVGRAIYHINQRRGFLSNRKEETKQSDGAVKQGIEDIDKKMKEYGCEYLGQYFYLLYQRGEKIRNHYTDRLNHHEKELLAVCRMQGLNKELTDKLHKAIITQRPLKSQKHTVGRCVFENKKTRCPASHPLFEQFRMYAFVNNIKMKTPADYDLRPLTEEEKRAIIPLFLRKSKQNFPFEEIAKKLSGGKNNYCYYKDREEKPYRFNYYMDTSVSGCTVNASLCDTFGVGKADDEEAWIDIACERYTQREVKGRKKSRYEVMNDVWHALFFFDDNDHLRLFAKEKLQMDDEAAEKFVGIRLPQDYGQLSLCAIRKILPYMKRYGLIYSHATFLANLASVLTVKTDADELCPALPKEDAADIVEAFDTYKTEYLPQFKNGEEHMSLDAYVKTCILRKYNLPDDLRLLDCLYHPSMMEKFPKVMREDEKKGCKLLGSPRTNSLRNPMAMHSLFRMRHVINTLLEKQVIDEDTTIHIEFARELNDSNRRAAIRTWQKDNEKRRNDCRDKIREHKGKDYEPTDDEILKCLLWEEQDHICLYTGATISLADLLASNRYDIEHTIPRSVGGDTTSANLTVCDSRFNREVKRNKMPSQLAEHEQILERIAHWKEKAEELDKQIRKLKTNGVADKDTKDNIIRKRHRLTLERDYWRGKYERFTMKEVPEGFARRQGVDISVISRYGKDYLKSLFHHVHVVKGIATSDFRKIWGLQEEDEKKARTNHCHHAVDAITIACIGKAEYDLLAQHYHNAEQHEWGLAQRQKDIPKPWATFTEDVKRIHESLLVRHYTRDNMPKHTKKRDPKQKGKFMEGDTARGSLHLDTYYGAIERDGEVKYVVRRNLDMLADKDVDTIVDDEVRRKVQEAILTHGSLKNAVAHGIWMNEEKGVAIKRVRCYAREKNLLSIRTQRDTSTREYKRSFHVKNENIYSAAIYEGIDNKGKTKREVSFFNYLSAASIFKGQGYENTVEAFPQTSKSGYQLKYFLRTGTNILLYENSPEELYSANNFELCKRLYRVLKFDSVGNRITVVFHQEAQSSGQYEVTGDPFEENKPIRAGLRMNLNQFHALVQGQDFTIDETGKIEFKHR